MSMRRRTKRGYRRSYKPQIQRNLTGAKATVIEVGFLKASIVVGHANFEIHTLTLASEEFQTYAQLYSQYKFYSVQVTWINRAVQVTGTVNVNQGGQAGLVVVQAAAIPSCAGVQAIREGLYDPSGNQVTNTQIVKIPGAKIWRITSTSTIYKRINSGNWFSASEPVGATSQAAHINYLVDYDVDLPVADLESFGYYMIKVKLLARGKKI